MWYWKSLICDFFLMASTFTNISGCNYLDVFFIIYMLNKNSKITNNACKFRLATV